ncbi:hypothetical protein SDC9_177167 [bioreactor metagenome]|uniref:Uncharacterized protein n=1 Tax=bioreactor metagenome TaxID=1076179 RepID=A0A645H080_9ZZZZ
MLKDLARNTDARSFGCDHKILFTQREDLTAHHARDACPAKKPEHRHEDKYSLDRVDLHLVHDGTDDHNNRIERNTVEQVDKTHDRRVDPAAEVAGDTAEHDTDERLQNDDHKADH